MNRQTRFYALAARYVALLGILLLLSFSALSQTPAKKFSAQEMDEILYHIHTYYVEDLPLSRYNQSNLSSLFDNLDPYSKYLDSEELEAIFSAANGRYTGLGIEVEEQGNYVTIVDTLPNSPAEIAGIERGDKLSLINNIDVTGKTIAEVSALLKAANKNQLQLVVLRGSSAVNIALKRQEIVLESVASKLLKDGTGFLSVNSFNHHTYHDVARQINYLQLQYGDALKKLVIDLRDNPGGTLNSAVAISDLFLDSGTIVTTKGRFFDANQAYFARQGDILNGAPIVVLINNNSASAAEILAAALKDNKRALVVGLRSYGKGSVQSLIPIGNGTTALKLTTARYYTPTGTSIEGTGVEPDVYFTKQALSLLDKSAIITGEESIKTNGIEQLASHWPKAFALVQSQ
ncbi:S41 family peptidase [Pseudoalteromonas sp. J010]|uniref:S41 family peptidase n=1 Tax=Pseudoalteromonas sp. J010 TaxID=998465 RepID=UPI000F653E6D|nr:S41 family peptidase [Pseudoalteromonas sp. J010]RRS07738.1 S41 family peptidase [Pseudoalteromonas sp. J010]